MQFIHMFMLCQNFSPLSLQTFEQSTPSPPILTPPDVAGYMVNVFMSQDSFIFKPNMGEGEGFAKWIERSILNFSRLFSSQYSTDLSTYSLSVWWPDYCYNRVSRFTILQNSIPLYRIQNRKFGSQRGVHRGTGGGQGSRIRI